MKRILIFSGTTEGRQLADILDASGICADVCVATGYGHEVMTEGQYRNIYTGRLTEEEMKAADMIAKLNANLSANAWGAGADGFPALLWEIDRTGSIESAGATAGIEIIKEGDRLVVVSATGERARLSVYDITGKAIVTAVVSDGDCVTVPGKGVCIVALVTDDGNCTTHKFLF